jgi:hypothetical protein
MFSLVKKHSMSEYGFCLQQLMRPNSIYDVEYVIEKALELEKSSRNKLQHSLSNSSLQSSSNRSNTAESQKPTSPMQNFSQNPLMNQLRNNSATPFLLPLQLTKPSTNKPKESEMNV